LEDTAEDGRIILRRIFKKWDVGHEWIDLAQVRTGGGNQTSGSIKCGEIVD
jgi:hypothetical protein